MKLITKNYTPAKWRYFHSDLDELRVLQEAYTNAADKLITEKFCNLIQDIKINGVTKFTYPGRLDHSKKYIHNLLKSNPTHNLSILDLGASDGITTHDLAQELSGTFNNKFHIYLADLNLYINRFIKGSLVEYRSAAGDPILLKIGKLAWRLPVPDKRSAVLSKWLIKKYLSLHSLRGSLNFDRRISLVSPAALHNNSIKTMEMDCFKFYPELLSSFDLIRASNLLNVAYFSKNQIKAALSNLFKYLKPNGYLVISRNPDEAMFLENGTIWQKSGNRLTSVGTIGEGSEVTALIDEDYTS